MNCHGEEIIAYFDRIPEIFTMYNYRLISTYMNLNDRSTLSEFNNCDILLTNNIKNYQFFTIEEIKKNVKNECQIIVIEFFRFKGFYTEEPILEGAIWPYDSLYYLPFDEYINYDHDETNIINKFNKSLEFIKELDNTSDIKLYDFISNNYRTKQLFRDYTHPHRNLYTEMVRQILLKLEIEPKKNINTIDFIHTFGTDIRYKLVPKKVKEVLKLEWDENLFYFYGVETTPLNFYNFTQSIKNENHTISWPDLYKKWLIFSSENKNNNVDNEKSIDIEKNIINNNVIEKNIINNNVDNEKSIDIEKNIINNNVDNEKSSSGMKNIINTLILFITSLSCK